MKKLVCACCMVLAFFVICYGGNKKNKQNKQTQNIAIDNIMTRVSVRHYSDKKVEQEKIDTIVKAAMAAPSGMNKQPWEILVVTDEQKLKDIVPVAPNARYSQDAPLVIIVCGDRNLSDALWVQDCCAATENVLLAAHALDLGAVWCMCYPIQEIVSGVQKLFNLPENIVPLSIIPIGYPLEKQQPKQKYDVKKVHINGWN